VSVPAATPPPSVVHTPGPSVSMPPPTAAASTPAVSGAASPAPAPSAPAPNTPAPSAPPLGQAPAVAAAIREIPLLSAQAAENLMSRSAAQVLEPPEVFRRAYGSVGRGLWALSRAESKELGDLHTLIYDSLPAAQRSRLGDYIDRARSRYATTPEEDRQMTQVMKSAVLALPADKRIRLQALFEKAMTAGLEKP
jgi:hypothetical protein